MYKRQKLTIGLIKGKLEEHRLLNSAKLVEIKPRDNITLGSFNSEMIHVNHSIPDAVGLAIRCPDVYKRQMIFNTDENIKSHNGIFDSPIEVNIVDRILYINKNGKPTK